MHINGLRLSEPPRDHDLRRRHLYCACAVGVHRLALPLGEGVVRVWVVELCAAVRVAAKEPEAAAAVRQPQRLKRRIAIKSNWPVKFSCHDAQFGSPHKNINKCVHAKKSLKELSRHKIFIVTALIYIPVPAPPQRSFVHLLPPPGPRNISPARPSPAERGAPLRVRHPHRVGGGRGQVWQVRGAGAKVEVEHLRDGEVDAVVVAEDDEHLTDLKGWGELNYFFVVGNCLLRSVSKSVKMFLPYFLPL